MGNWQLHIMHFSWFSRIASDYYIFLFRESTVCVWCNEFHAGYSANVFQCV